MKVSLYRTPSYVEPRDFHCRTIVTIPCQGDRLLFPTCKLLKTQKFSLALKNNIQEMGEMYYYLTEIKWYTNLIQIFLSQNRIFQDDQWIEINVTNMIMNSSKKKTAIYYLYTIKQIDFTTQDSLLFWWCSLFYIGEKEIHILLHYVTHTCILKQSWTKCNTIYLRFFISKFLSPL